MKYELEKLRQYEHLPIVQQAARMRLRFASLWLQYCVFFLKFDLFALCVKPTLSNMFAHYKRMNTEMRSPLNEFMEFDDEFGQTLEWITVKEFSFDKVYKPFRFLMSKCGLINEAIQSPGLAAKMGLLFEEYRIPVITADEFEAIAYKPGLQKAEELYGAYIKPEHVWDPNSGKEFPSYRSIKTVTIEKEVIDSTEPEIAEMKEVAEKMNKGLHITKDAREKYLNDPGKYVSALGLMWRAADIKEASKPWLDALMKNIEKKENGERSITVKEHKVIKTHFDATGLVQSNGAYFEPYVIERVTKQEKMVDANLVTLKKLYSRMPPPLLRKRHIEIENRYNVLSVEDADIKDRLKYLEEKKEVRPLIESDERRVFNEEYEKKNPKPVSIPYVHTELPTLNENYFKWEKVVAEYDAGVRVGRGTYRYDVEDQNYDYPNIAKRYEAMMLKKTGKAVKYTREQFQKDIPRILKQKANDRDDCAAKMKEVKDKYDAELAVAKAKNEESLRKSSSGSAKNVKRWHQARDAAWYKLNPHLSPGFDIYSNKAIDHEMKKTDPKSLANQERSTKLRAMDDAIKLLKNEEGLLITPFVKFETWDECHRIIKNTPYSLKLSSLKVGSPTMYALIDDFPGADIASMYMLWRMMGKTKRWSTHWKLYCNHLFRGVHWRVVINIFASDSGVTRVKCNNYLLNKFVVGADTDVKIDSGEWVYFGYERDADVYMDKRVAKLEERRTLEAQVQNLETKFLNPAAVMDSVIPEVDKNRILMKIRLHNALLAAIGDINYIDGRRVLAKSIVPLNYMRKDAKTLFLN
jgi:hypothetical protein